MENSDGQEELIGLFARNMTFTNPTPPPEEPQPIVSSPLQNGSSIIAVFASQHYTPNRHVTPIRFQTPPEPQSPTQQQQQHYLNDDQVIDLLKQNSIDPHQLIPSQVDLFRKADTDQRLRLLELWRIAPLNLGVHNMQQENSALMETNLHKEELLAKMRYEKLLLLRNRSGTPELRNVQEEMSWGHETTEPKERPSTAPEHKAQMLQQHNAEPYMLSGYEMLMKRDYECQAAKQQEQTPLRETTKYNQATDPIFQHSSGLWQKSVQSQQLDMENQYGTFEQMRETHQGFGSCMLDLHVGGMDEDIMML